MDKRLLKEIKASLAAAYGERLKGIVLFGSAARGDDTEDSDIDLFILFRDAVSLARDLKGILRTLSPIQLGLKRSIHPIPVNETLFNSGKFAIFRKAKSEGIVL